MVISRRQVIQAALFSLSTLSALSALGLAAPSQAEEKVWLQAHELFATTSRQVQAREVVFEFEVPPLHALERQNFRFQAAPNVIERVIYPPLSPKQKPGHTQYLQKVRIRVLLAKGRGHSGQVTAIAQGCNMDLDICFPPFQLVHTLKWP
jgi:hypothetical protein